MALLELMSTEAYIGVMSTVPHPRRKLPEKAIPEDDTYRVIVGLCLGTWLFFEMVKSLFGLGPSLWVSGMVTVVLFGVGAFLIDQRPQIRN